MIHIFLCSGIFGLGVVLVFLLLFLAGLVVIAVTRSRRAARVFLLLAFLPLLLGLCGTYFGYRQVDAAINDRSITPEEANLQPSCVTEGRREARYSSYLGAAASALLLAFAGCGVALTRNSNKQAMTDG